MENKRDWLHSDAFLAVVADSISCHSQLQEHINNIYELEKYRFYEAARNSSVYNELSMPRGRLPLEVASKRNLGVLLVARDDRQVYVQIRPALINLHPAFSAYLKNPSKAPSFEQVVFESIGNARLGLQKSISLLMISAYVLVNELGFAAEQSQICKAAMTYGEIYVSMNAEWANSKTEPNLDLSSLLSMYHFSQEDWRYIKSFLRPDYITLLRESYRRGEPLQRYTDDAVENFSTYSDVNEKEKAIVTAWALTSVMSKAGIDWENLCYDISLSKTQQFSILQACLDMSMVTGGFRPHHYISAFIVYVLCKEIISTKDFYWRNNAETQFMETQHLLHENKELKAKVLRLEQRLTDIEIQQRKEAEAQAKQSQTDYFEATKPLRDENLLLAKKIQELELQLSESRKNSVELSLLRAICLSAPNPETNNHTYSLLEQKLQEKKIIFFGGSLNLRKKISNKFPNLCVLDGTETIVDLKFFDNADMVLIYTYNMSHALYERVITYIKQNDIPYFFLARASNAELIEAQMNKILTDL